MQGIKRIGKSIFLKLVCRFIKPFLASSAPDYKASFSIEPAYPHGQFWRPGWFFSWRQVPLLCLHTKWAGRHFYI